MPRTSASHNIRPQPDRRRTHVPTLAITLLTLSTFACEKTPIHPPPTHVDSSTTHLIIAWRALPSGATPTTPAASPRHESILWRSTGSGFVEVGRSSRIALLSAPKATSSATPHATTKLLHVDHATVPHAEVDCACDEDAGFSENVDPACITKSTVTQPVVRGADGGEQGPFARAGAAPQPNGSSDTSYALTSSFGSLLLWTECTHSYACGAAHGSHRCQQVVWDAARGARTEALGPKLATISAVLRRGGRRLALQAFMRDGDFTLPRDGDDSEKPEFARLNTRLDQRGHLRASVDVSGRTDYASSSEWAAYTTQVAVRLGSLPGPLKPYNRLPTPARRAWSEPPTSFGWSQVAVDSRTADALSVAFRAMSPAVTSRKVAQPPR